MPTNGPLRQVNASYAIVLRRLTDISWLGVVEVAYVGVGPVSNTGIYSLLHITAVGSSSGMFI